MKKLILMLAIVVMAGCELNSEVSALEAMSDGKKIWIFAQFNVPEEGDKIDSYYYYGKISDSVYHGIKQNKLSHGFIHLQQVRYWGDDDLIHDYKDIEHSGELIFRIENIVRLSLINTPPAIGKGYDQFEEEPLQKSSPAKTNAL